LNGVLLLCQDISGYFKFSYKLPDIMDTIGSFNFDLKVSINKKTCDGLIILKLLNINTKQSE
jgi:hypothetical protein